MSSLDKQYAAILGFFSYSREDDRGDRGALSTLRQVIQSELSAQLGRAQKSCRIWQDQAAIPVGTEWENQIKLGISQSVFFIPIITPRVVRSERCAFEFEAFLARERELGRDDLVFPFLYIDVPELDDERIWHADPVLSVVGARQYFDGRDLRFKPVAEARASIGQFCRNIANAIRREWETPEEQRRLEAEGQAKAEEEGRRRAAEQQAEEKRQRRKAQAEEKRRKEAEAETARLAEEERQRREAEAARVAEEKRRKEAEAETAPGRGGTQAPRGAGRARRRGGKSPQGSRSRASGQGGKAPQGSRGRGGAPGRRGTPAA